MSSDARYIRNSEELDTFEKLRSRKKLRRSRRGNNKSIPKRKNRPQSL